MIFRALALAGLFSLACATGCSTNEACRAEQHPAPDLKGGNIRRVATEVGWLWASVQDIVFGINYHCDIEHEFPSHLYE